MMGMIRSLIRRTIALLASAAVVVYSTLCFSVSAEESGYWKLVDQRETEKIINPERDGLSYTDEGSAAAGFHIRKVITEHAMRGPYSDSPGQKGHKDCSGEFGDQTITFSPLPPAQIQAGETISIHAHVTCSTSTHMLDPGGYAYIRLHWDLDANRFAYFSDENSAWDDKSIIKPLPEQRGDQAAHVGEFSGTFSAEMPAGNTGSHSKLYIVFGLTANLKSIDSIYEYEWVDTSETEPVAAVTEETTNEATEWIEQTVNKDAEATDGTDSGAVINPDIVTGKNNTAKKAAAGAVGAAIVGGAVASAVSSKKKKNPVIYKMVIGKDFGDTISPGGKYHLTAKIIQIHTVTGQTHDANELTAKIKVSSEELDIRTALSGDRRLMRVSASLTHPVDSETASVVFTFTGKGGEFRERVKFKLDLTREIALVYFKQNGEIARRIKLGGQYVVEANSGRVRGIPSHKLFTGEDINTKLCIAVKGFYQQPALTVSSGSKDLVTQPAVLLKKNTVAGEAMTEQEFLFTVILDNRTKKPETLFCRSEVIQLNITASAGKVTQTSVLPVEIFPRGFFYDLRLCDERQKSTEYAELYTNELIEENKPGLKPTILPVKYGYEFVNIYGCQVVNCSFAHVSGKANEVFTTNSVNDAKIRLECRLTAKSVSNDSTDHIEMILFQPEMPALVEKPDDVLRYDMKVFAAAGRGHENAEGTIPVGVYGEPRDSEFRARHKELASLSRLIRLMDLEETDAKTAVDMLMQRKASVPTADLSRVRHWIFDYGMQRQEFIYREEMSKAVEYGKKIVYLTGVKWACDTAFGMLLKIYCETHQPPLDSDLVDAIVSPLKTYLEEIAADASVAYFWDVPFDYMSLLDPSRFLRIMEDTLSGLMLKDADKADWKALVKVLVLASLVSALKNTLIECKNEYDAKNAGQTPEVSLWWRIIRETMKDMTRRTLKIAVSKYLINGPLNFKPPIVDQDVYEAVVGNLPGTDAYADSVLELARDLQIANGSEPYDVVLERMAQRFGTMELTLANGSKVTVSKIKAILMYTDKFLEQWGAAKLKQFFEQPVQLPVQQPYIGWRDTEQLLGQHGFDTSEIHWS